MAFVLRPKESLETSQKEQQVAGSEMREVCEFKSPKEVYAPETQIKG